MTKPSYEELERELAEWRSSATADTLKRHQEELGRETECRVANQDRVRELYAELLRVRGLLQRAQDLLSEARENLMAVHISGAITSGSNLAGMCGLNAQAITRFKEETAPIIESEAVSEIIPAPVAYDGVPFHYVMQEPDGRIIGVAPERRRTLVTEWLHAATGRKVWQAYENT